VQSPQHWLGGKYPVVVTGRWGEYVYRRELFARVKGLEAGNWVGRFSPTYKKKGY